MSAAWTRVDPSPNRLSSGRSGEFSIHFELEGLTAVVEAVFGPDPARPWVVVGAAGSLRGEPVRGPRPLVVCQVSREARGRGVRAGVSPREAKRRCPSARIVAPASDGGAAAARALATDLAPLAPRIEVRSMSEIVVHLSGCHRPTVSERVAARVNARLASRFGLRARVAIQRHASSFVVGLERHTSSTGIGLEARAEA